MSRNARSRSVGFLRLCCTPTSPPYYANGVVAVGAPCVGKRWYKKTLYQPQRLVGTVPLGTRWCAAKFSAEVARCASARVPGYLGTRYTGLQTPGTGTGTGTGVPVPGTRVGILQWYKTTGKRKKGGGPPSFSFRILDGFSSKSVQNA
eukprot:1712492-Rhodomonas_salina.1